MIRSIQLAPRRLSNLDQWELYELTSESGGTKVVVAMRPLSEHRAMEYEIWRDLGADPWRQGSIPCSQTGEDWPSASRPDLLQAIMQDALRTL